MSIQAVVFDMDGVIIDSETVWHEVRRDFVVGHGGTWTEQDQKAVMGANSRQWAEHIRDACGVALPRDQIYSEVVSGLREAYREHLPLYEGCPRGGAGSRGRVSTGRRFLLTPGTGGVCSGSGGTA